VSDPVTGNVPDELIRREFNRVIEDWYADGLACMDDPDFHVPLSERLLDVVKDIVLPVVRRQLADENEQLQGALDEALTLLADAIPDPKGAIDSPAWNRRMDALAARVVRGEPQ